MQLKNVVRKKYHDIVLEETKIKGNDWKKEKSDRV